MFENVQSENVRIAVQLLLESKELEKQIKDAGVSEEDRAKKMEKLSQIQSQRLEKVKKLTPNERREYGEIQEEINKDNKDFLRSGSAAVLSKSPELQESPQSLKSPEPQILEESSAAVAAVQEFVATTRKEIEDVKRSVLADLKQYHQAANELMLKADNVGIAADQETDVGRQSQDSSVESQSSSSEAVKTSEAPEAPEVSEALVENISSSAELLSSATSASDDKADSAEIMQTTQFVSQVMDKKTADRLGVDLLGQDSQVKSSTSLVDALDLAQRNFSTKESGDSLNNESGNPTQLDSKVSAQANFEKQFDEGAFRQEALKRRFDELGLDYNVKKPSISKPSISSVVDALDLAISSSSASGVSGVNKDGQVSLKLVSEVLKDSQVLQEDKISKLQNISKISQDSAVEIYADTAIAILNIDSEGDEARKAQKLEALANLEEEFSAIELEGDSQGEEAIIKAATGFMSKIAKNENITDDVKNGCYEAMAGSMEKIIGKGFGKDFLEFAKSAKDAEKAHNEQKEAHNANIEGDLLSESEEFQEPEEFKKEQNNNKPRKDSDELTELAPLLKILGRGAVAIAMAAAIPGFGLLMAALFLYLTKEKDKGKEEEVYQNIVKESGLDGAQAISDGLKRGEQTAESIKAQEGLQKAMEQMNQQEMEPLDRVQDLEGQQEVSVEAESTQQSQSFVEQVEEQRQKQKQKQGQDLGGSNNGR